MKSDYKITAKKLRELIEYDPISGQFIWRVSRKGGGTKAGYPAGRVRAHDGYIRLGINGARHFAHRLAWLYVYGEFPRNQIDHIDGIRHNNSIQNLREATGTQNLGNMSRPSHNSSGFKGVSWHKGAGKWRAYIKNKGRAIHLGHFDDAKLAHAAYLKAAQSYFGSFARAN